MLTRLCAQVRGVRVTVTETTQRVLGERRLKATQALAARTREAKTVHQACAISGTVLSEYPEDIPFAWLYLIDPHGTYQCSCSQPEPAMKQGWTA